MASTDRVRLPRWDTAPKQEPLVFLWLGGKSKIDVSQSKVKTFTPRSTFARPIALPSLSYILSESVSKSSSSIQNGDHYIYNRNHNLAAGVKILMLGTEMLIFLGATTS